MNILVFNPGSSSLKFARYEVAAPGQEREISTGSRERLGIAAGTTTAQAARQVVGEMDAAAVDAVGCRVVHGGARFIGPTHVDDAVLAAIRDLGRLAPLHNGTDADVIEAVRAAWPERPVVAVFDTGFHRTLPDVATAYALPAELCAREKLRRYGFHGIAHQWVSERLVELLGRPAAGTRLVTCHLGNGASACAVRDGRSVDTSMGLTPLEGLVMGTRAGDLDPGVVLYLLRENKMSVEELSELLNRRSGLRGLSGGRSSDVRDLLAASAAGDAQAELALEVFAYRAAKYVGAYAVALEGLDALAFSGGIGEHAPEVRARICRRLGVLGVRLDEKRNAAADGREPARISADDGSVQCWVVPADENRQIAREVYGLEKTK